jgi:4-hydroxy-2-oxoheptanedioate aldolase
MIVVSLAGGIVMGQAKRRQRLNPMIDLLEQKKPIFGLYMPREMSAASAKLALDNHQIDYLFSGGAPQGFPEFVKGLAAGGVLRQAERRLSHPIMLKIHKIAEDPARAQTETSEQLNLGTSGQMFVEVESAGEVQKGLAMMRFKSKGGTRPDTVGSAPAYWGMTEQEYRNRADVWPLNPDGELVNWTIIESKEGLAHTREIAAVKGIGVLWPGAGTLGGVFSKTGPDGKPLLDANGRRVRDDVAWENSIQQVLAACKEFNVPCGYPATVDNIEMRLKQGFSVFVISSDWTPDNAGFKAVQLGRKVAGRETSNN